MSTQNNNTDTAIVTKDDVSMELEAFVNHDNLRLIDVTKKGGQYHVEFMHNGEPFVRAKKDVKEWVQTYREEFVPKDDAVVPPVNNDVIVFE